MTKEEIYNKLDYEEGDKLIIINQKEDSIQKTIVGISTRIEELGLIEMVKASIIKSLTTPNNSNK